MTHEIFNLIRSFSFVGEIGEDPEDYRYIAPLPMESETEVFSDETTADEIANTPDEQ